MARYVGYIAMSLDGFIADTDGGVGWLDAYHAEGDDFGYAEFIAPVDAVLMGRKTYNQVLSWGWPYQERPGYVLSHDTTLAGPHVAAAGSLPDLQAAIRAAGHQTVWVLGGGQAQRAVLDAGIFHTLRVFVMPLILGDGAPLFEKGARHAVTLSGVTAHTGGVAELVYTIA